MMADCGDNGQQFQTLASHFIHSLPPTCVHIHTYWKYYQVVVPI